MSERGLCMNGLGPASASPTADAHPVSRSIVRESSIAKQTTSTADLSPFANAGPVRSRDFARK
jgi:hypothetical protein